MRDVIKEMNDIIIKAEAVNFDVSKISDGHHTFEELYKFRLAYNALIFNEWATQCKYKVHKSYRHESGELCFGGGWFIVVAELPTGQITNHYRLDYWDWFKIPETEKALLAYDGHTPNDTINRIDDFIKLDGFETSSVNRVEVIDNKGRSYVNWKHKLGVQLSLQDEGRTLKVFING